MHRGENNIGWYACFINPMVILHAFVAQGQNLFMQILVNDAQYTLNRQDQSDDA